MKPLPYFCALIFAVFISSQAGIRLNANVSYSSTFLEDIASLGYSQSLLKDKLYLETNLNYHERFLAYANSTIGFHYKSLTLGYNFTDAYTQLDRKAPDFTHASGIFFGYKWSDFNRISIKFDLKSFGGVSGGDNTLNYSEYNLILGKPLLGMVAEASALGAQYYGPFEEQTRLDQAQAGSHSYIDDRLYKLFLGLRSSFMKYEVMLGGGMMNWSIQRNLSWPASSQMIALNLYEGRLYYSINDAIKARLTVEVMPVTEGYPGVYGLDYDDNAVSRHVEYPYPSGETHYRIGAGISCDIK